MKKVLLSTLIGAALLVGCGSTGHQATHHKHLPCAKIENDESRCSAQAYIEIQAAMQDMTPFCKSHNWGVQAWAEANYDQPKGYEVLASCAGNLPSVEPTNSGS